MSKWTQDETPVCAELFELALSYGLPTILANYVGRIQTLSKDNLSDFITKSTSQLHDPFLLDGMHHAVQKVSEYIDNGSKIIIFGDFDVDGVTGASILYWGVRKAGLKDKPLVYIPNRFTEGHGLNLEAIDKFHSQGVKLIITADCGMGNHTEVDHAKSLGIDVVVTDHHMGKNELLKAEAVINPRLGNYPFEHLSGAGVAYKFIQALLSFRFGEESDEYNSTMESCIDYVAIGTVADVMPLIGENRVLVDWGLKNMAKSRLPFIKKYWSAKLRNIELNEPFTAEHIGFQMAPRINAASRLESGIHAFDFLTSVKVEDVIQKGRYLDFLNSERKSRLAALKESQKLIKYYVQDRRVLIINSQSTEKGLFGLLASYFLESEDQLIAVLVLGDDPNGQLSGSARARSGFNWFTTMQVLQDYFTRFGGHAEAAGCMIERNKLEDFLRQFDKLELSYELTQSAKYYHGCITCGDINEKLVTYLEDLGPYGEKFPRPIFKITDFNVLRSRRVGPGGRDLSFLLQGSLGVTFKGIGFHLGYLQDQLSEATGLISELNYNYFKNQEVQIRLLDVV